LPVRLALSPGEAHDVRLAGKPRSRLKPGSMLLADRGYDADWIRELAMKKGAWADIPPKSNRSDPICFSPYLIALATRVERFFNRIKQCRRVATRYDRLAGNYLAFVQLASIRLWLAARYEPTPWINRHYSDSKPLVAAADPHSTQAMPRRRSGKRSWSVRRPSLRLHNSGTSRVITGFGYASMSPCQTS
jgi:transposase